MLDRCVASAVTFFIVLSWALVLKYAHSVHPWGVECNLE